MLLLLGSVGAIYELIFDHFYEVVVSLPEIHEFYFFGLET